jgi:hypothetical protein
MKRLFIPLIMLLLIAAALPVTAQEDENLTADQRDLLTYINEAIDNLNQSDSYAVHYHSAQTNTTTYDDGNAYDSDTETKSDAQGSFDPGGSLVTARGSMYLRSVSQEQGASTDDSGDTPDNDMSGEFILIDDHVYARNDLPLADMLGFTHEEAATMNDTWFALSYDDLRGLASMDYGLPGIRIKTAFLPVVTPIIDGQFQIAGFQPQPFEEAGVLSIVELENESIDGQIMRVFELTLDPLPVVWGHDDRSVLPWNPPDPLESFGSDGYQALQRYFQERVQVNQKIWIRADDHLLYLVTGSSQGGYNTKEIQETAAPFVDSDNGTGDTNITIDFSGSTTITYSGFNEPFTVEAPSNTLNLIDFFEPEGDPGSF